MRLRMSAARALADAGARDESAGAGDGGVKMHGDGSGSAVTSTNERRAMKRSDEKVEETESCVAQPAQLAAGELAGREVAEAVSVARRRAAPAPPEPSKTRASPCHYRIVLRRVASAVQLCGGPNLPSLARLGSAPLSTVELLV